MNDDKTGKNTNANQKKLFPDELWIAHAAFPAKKKNPSLKIGRAMQEIITVRAFIADK